MRLRLRSFVLLLLFTTFSVAAMAQSAVKGTVKDETGNPMIGVAVSVPGTSIGTSTDAAGNYQIKAAADQKLQFNFLGFKPQLVDIDNRSVIDIVMTEDNTSLEEVVVVGYGVQKRRDIIGAVETLSADKLDGRLGQYQNAARSLQGAIPGMTVSFSDGKPNRGATMRIRGNVTSIGMGGDALVLVDGVEQALETVNPEDIESFTVLKDASSTAVYGVRGTFGVVLVTTKNPDKGSAKISYNGSFSLYQRTTTPQMVTNGYDWTTSFLESYINRAGSDPANINNVFKFSRQWYDELARRNADPSFEKWRINPGSGRYEYFGNTNWYDLFYRDVALGHTHSVTVQGGGDKATYYVNGRYFYQDGMYKEGNEYYDQYNVTARGTVKVRPWLRLDNTTTFYYHHSNQPQGHTGINNTMTPVRMIAHQGYPMTMPYNPDGSWTQTAVYTGYAGFVEGNNWRRDHKFDFRNKTSLTIDLIKDVLTAKGTLGYYYNHTLREILIYPSIYSNGPGMTGQQVADSKFEERTYDRDNIMGDATLTWTPRLGEDHNFSAMAGWSIDNIVYNSRAMERYGISDPDKPNPSMSTNSETMMYKDNGSYDWGMVGAFFRLSYGYKSRYLFEFSGRYDGCSKLMSNERWAFAPSGSFGWRISEEPFMEGARSWLDNLKIRLSAGQSANGLLNKYYEFEQVMDIKTSTVLSNGAFMTYTKAPALIPSGLTWEMATKYDIGIDFEALNGRLNIVADAYRTYTNDMYVTGPELPAVFGQSVPKGNYADMETNGYEISVSWRDSFMAGSKPFSYNIKAMFWDSTSKLNRYTSKTGTLPTNYTNNYYEGMTLGEIWGYTADGLFETDAEAATLDYSKFANGNQVFRAGDLRLVDLNDDGAINNGANTIYDHGDLRVIGNTTPRYCYSIQAGFNWNGLGFSMLWQGVGQRDWYPAKESNYFWGQYGRPYSMALPWHAERYTDDNPDTGAYWPRLTGYQGSASGGLFATPNTHFLQKARYIRLKNLTVDYTLPKDVVKKIGLQNLKIYVSGENLLTFSPLNKHAKNFDPEGITPGDKDIQETRGGDNSGDGEGYPMLRSYTIGLNITF